MKPSESEITSLALKLLYIGLGIDVAGAVILFFGGISLADRGLRGDVEIESLQILGYVLLAVAVIELLVVVVLKKKWLYAGSDILSRAKSYKQLSSQLVVLHIILYFVALSPAIYGFLYYMLGGDQQQFVLMACLTLIGYMMVRPRPQKIADLINGHDYGEDE